MAFLLSMSMQAPARQGQGIATHHLVPARWRRCVQGGPHEPAEQFKEMYHGEEEEGGFKEPGQDIASGGHWAGHRAGRGGAPPRLAHGATRCGAPPAPLQRCRGGAATPATMASMPKRRRASVGPVGSATPPRPPVLSLTPRPLPAARPQHCRGGGAALRTLFPMSSLRGRRRSQQAGPDSRQRRLLSGSPLPACALRGCVL